MNQTRIKMKYHPILEEVKFWRWENKSWARINENSALNTCFENKAVFLQNLGTELMDSILRACNESAHILIEFVGTKGDFDDLKAMTEYYNEKKQNGSERISVELMMELPEIRATYEDVKQYGEKVIELLNEYASSEETLDRRFKEIANKMIQDVNILEDNDVNLCFVGGYSSGKSTLINAILGYGILPVSISPETAKMFKIINEEKPSIHFNVFDSKTQVSTKMIIDWDAKQRSFTITNGPNENEVRQTIQNKLNDINFKNKPMHTQMRCILEVVNKWKNVKEKTDNEKSYNNIEGVIEVYFTIPLGGKMNFTIFDTPGPDSIHKEHINVLKTALKEQINSILVYVNWPNKGQSAANQQLSELIRDINHDNEDNYSSINLKRSLFVMNGSDTLNNEIEFEELKRTTLSVDADMGTTYEEVVDLEKLKVSLEDKRIFFTAASVAYAAKAIENGIAELTEEKELKKNRYTMIEDEDRGYYRHNRLSKAEHETQEMIRICAEKAKTAEDKNDETRQYIINSGLYALEREIIKYSEKYALAVKTRRLFDSIASPIEKLMNEHDVLEQNKHKELSEIKMLIDKTMVNMKAAINNQVEMYIRENRIEQSGNINHTAKNVLKEIGIEKKFLNEIIKKVVESEKKNIKALKLIEFGKDGVGIRKELERSNHRVKLILKEEYDEKMSNHFENKLSEDVQEMQKLIRGTLDTYTEASSEMINYIKAIDDPKIKYYGNFKLEVPIIDKKIIFLPYKEAALKKESIIQEVERRVKAELDDRYEFYSKKYNELLETACHELADGYIGNIDRLSGRLIEMSENQALVEAELEKIALLQEKLSKIKLNLDRKIGGKYE